MFSPPMLTSQGETLLFFLLFSGQGPWTSLIEDISFFGDFTSSNLPGICDVKSQREDREGDNANLVL